jgi:hypothetical protein
MFTRWTVAVGLALTLVGPAPADDLAKLDTSLNKVPADVAIYGSALRLGEQLDLFLKSKAYEKLSSLPAVRAAWDHVHAEMHKGDNPLHKIIDFMHAPENAELREVVHGLMRREVFAYSGENAVRFLTLAGQVNLAVQFAPLTARLKGEGDKPQEAIQLEALLDALKEGMDELVVPDLVIGFRVDNPKAVVNQVGRLEALLQQALAEAPPAFRNRLKRSQAGALTTLAYVLDGALVPWNEIPWDRYDLDADDYKKLIDKLKGMTVTVALTVKEDYLLVTVGGDTKAAESFGRGAALAGRPEFAPLVKFADRRLTSISYSSEKLSAAMSTSADDLKDLVAEAKEGLEAARLSDKLREAIGKDLEKLAKEMAAYLPKPAATMSFAFLTDRGDEGYSYVFDASPAVAPGPLTVLDHTGGAPILAAAGRGVDATPRYKSLVKWITTFYGHGLAAAEELGPEGVVEQIKTTMQQVLPFLERFDTITGTQLLPALADGQSALVIDGRWKSKRWFPDLDQKGKELPMVEIGLVLGVSDADLLVKAFKGYRELVNDLLNVARGFGASIPEQGWPAPKTKKSGDATLFYWPVPHAGQDESILPNIGVSSKVLTVALSTQQAERLQRATPMKAELKQLAGDRPLLAANFVDFNALVDLGRPWFDTFALPQIEANTPEDGPAGLRRADVAPQLKVVIDVLQCLKTYRDATYREGNATVTHSETVVRDLK